MGEQESLDAGFLWAARHQIHKALAEAISVFSNVAWTSSWNSDVEFELWDLIVSGEEHRFSRMLADKERRFYRSLAEAADGWIMWKPGTVEDLLDHEISHNGGVGFVPMDEWLKIFAEWKAKNK